MITYGIMQGRLTPSNGRGIQFFPFDNWANEFGIASELGLDEIEFIFDYDNYISNPLWTNEGIDKINKLTDDTGVKVKSLCFDYFMRRPFYKYDGKEQEKVKDENKRILLQMFYAMKRIGGALIEIPAVDNSSLKTEVEKKLFSTFLKEIIKETDDEYGEIKVGLETDLTVEDFVHFIDEIGSKRLGANYDSGNSSGLGYDLYKEVTGLGNRIFNIHIKDRVYMGTTVALGTGSANFDELFKGLKEIHYNESFIIQAARGTDGNERNTIDKQRKFISDYVERML
ncbi:MAG: sugar phosphate isomerase/epimerase [Lachnospiraceae bacterium]|nr:sugar phosphate isomerase/epimerase [Lachnospiraceae bacterium]